MSKKTNFQVKLKPLDSFSCIGIKSEFKKEKNLTFPPVDKDMTSSDKSWVSVFECTGQISDEDADDESSLISDEMLDINDVDTEHAEQTVEKDVNLDINDVDIGHAEQTVEKDVDLDASDLFQAFQPKASSSIRKSALCELNKYHAEYLAPIGSPIEDEELNTEDLIPQLRKMRISDLAIQNNGSKVNSDHTECTYKDGTPHISPTKGEILFKAEKFDLEDLENQLANIHVTDITSQNKDLENWLKYSGSNSDTDDVELEFKEFVNSRLNSTSCLMETFDSHLWQTLEKNRKKSEKQGYNKTFTISSAADETGSQLRKNPNSMLKDYLPDIVKSDCETSFEQFICERISQSMKLSRESNSVSKSESDIGLKQLFIEPNSNASYKNKFSFNNIEQSFSEVIGVSNKAFTRSSAADETGSQLRENPNSMLKDYSPDIAKSDCETSFEQFICERTSQSMKLSRESNSISKSESDLGLKQLFIEPNSNASDKNKFSFNNIEQSFTEVIGECDKNRFQNYSIMNISILEKNSPCSKIQCQDNVKQQLIADVNNAYDKNQFKDNSCIEKSLIKENGSCSKNQFQDNSVLQQSFTEVIGECDKNRFQNYSVMNISILEKNSPCSKIQCQDNVKEQLITDINNAYDKNQFKDNSDIEKSIIKENGSCFKNQFQDNSVLQQSFAEVNNTCDGKQFKDDNSAIKQSFIEENICSKSQFQNKNSVMQQSSPEVNITYDDQMKDYNSIVYQSHKEVSKYCANCKTSLTQSKNKSNRSIKRLRNIMDESFLNESTGDFDSLSQTSQQKSLFYKYKQRLSTIPVCDITITKCRAINLDHQISSKRS